jgi:amino acid transporter
MSGRDVTLFIIVSVFGLRWIAVAAGAGPSSLIVWVGAAIVFFIPLIICVLEMGRRFPEEGGLYTWVKHAFGNYPAFITGWTYWTANLPFFPGLLYFAAGNALLAIPGGERYSDSGVVIASLALIGLAVAAIPNILGINRGKWVQNLGALGYWVPATVVIVLGTWMFVKHGSATPINAQTIVPHVNLDHALAWSTITFALGGVEGVALVVTQIRNPREVVPRAIFAAAVIVLLLYILGTLALMWAIPSSEISSIGGFVQAMDSLGSRVGVNGLGHITGAFLTVGAIGGVGAWITATARLPYVAGVDRYLPAAFGNLHPRYGTPHVAIITQITLCAILILIGQAGSTVRGAYDLLVAMTVIFTFIPLMLMFASAFQVGRNAQPSSEAWVSPAVLTVSGAMGFAVVFAATLLALVPAANETRPVFAVVKLLMLTVMLLGVGTVLFLRGGRTAPSLLSE